MKPVSMAAFVVLITMTLTSCTFTNTRKNDVKDRDDAEEVMREFYALRKEKKNEEAMALFGEKFFTVTSKEKLEEIIRKVDGTLGDLRAFELDSWETKRVSGTESYTYYELIYKVTYSKFSATERVGLYRKDEDGLIQIVGYRTNSNGFDNV